MESKRMKKIEHASENLRSAIKIYYKRSKDDELPFLTVCKTLEVLFEYLWKEFKGRIEDQGLFAASPKEAIKQAAVIGLIENPERWLLIAGARNDSVHDYFGIPEEKYISFAEEFLDLVGKIKWD